MKMKQALALLPFLILYVVANETVDYNGYSVYKIVPRTLQQVNSLKKLQKENINLSFWTEPTKIGRPVRIMASPKEKAKLKEFLRKNALENVMYINNLQTFISSGMIRSRLRSVGFDFKDYYRLDIIYSYLEGLASQYPDKIKLIQGGRTFEGRNITGVHLTFSKANKNKAIFLEGGIHGREWISPATVLYILTQLLNSGEKNVRQVAESYDWYVFPVFNPDGYEFSHTTDRLWRKTRKPNKQCVGTDPNRNWGFHWMESDVNKYGCAETYAGTSAFSEIETKSMSEYITTLKDSLVAYIAFHSFGQLLLSPYGHTFNHVENYDDLKRIGTKALDTLSSRHGTEYLYGSLAESTNQATGSSIDWAKGKLGTRIAFIYELRDTGEYGFLLPAEQIIPTGEETLDSLVALLQEASKVK